MEYIILYWINFQHFMLVVISLHFFLIFCFISFGIFFPSTILFCLTLLTLTFLFEFCSKQELVSAQPNFNFVLFFVKNIDKLKEAKI